MNLFEIWLPWKRLDFIINQDNKWIISYEHGGLGYHHHTIYFEIHNGKILHLMQIDGQYPSSDSLLEAILSGKVRDKEIDYCY